MYQVAGVQERGREGADLFVPLAQPEGEAAANAQCNSCGSNDHVLLGGCTWESGSPANPTI
jgi:hypothetical protein